MTTTINASPTNGLVQTADGSGVLKVQSNGVTTNALAWVNFNGTGTVAIRSAYNVSSITDNGTGSYIVNFTNALSDANYAGMVTAAGQVRIGVTNGQTPSALLVITFNELGALADSSVVAVAVFGN